MEEQINNQAEPHSDSAELVGDPKSSAPTSSSANILDVVSAVGAIGGAVASLITQQFALAAFPLALSVGVHIMNRRQSINALQQHIENMVLQQNLHIVSTQQNVQAVQEELGQFERQSWLTLEKENQDHQVIMAKLSEQIEQLQQQTSNLDQSTLSLESKQQELTNVVEELRQIENYSQALRVESSAAEIYYQRGFSHQRLGDKQGAIEDYSEAIRHDPKYVQAYHSRGVLYGELGKRKLAVADLRQASKLYFEQGDIDSYQQARDLGKQFYDLRDVMEEQAAHDAHTEKLDSKDQENNGQTKFKALSLVSVEHLFA